MRHGPNCGNCRYSSPEIVDFNAAGDEEPTPILLCHRYPPTMIATGIIGHEGRTTDAAMAFPQVQSTDWCGEWQPPEPEYAGTGGEQ